MTKTIKDVLENTTNNYPNKIAFEETSCNITYREFYDKCLSGASFLLEKKLQKRNVLIFIDKSINCLEAMFSCICATAVYTVVDIKSPLNRIESIMTTLHPAAVITDEKSSNNARELGLPTYLIEEMITYTKDENAINNANDAITDSDPLYILFTSGSTGIPKGSVISHRSVIAYAEDICDTFKITEDTIFGSQTPFYFSMSILDIFSTILSGATFNIIPKMYFSFPVKLIEYLNTYKINTIYWVPSALSIVANLKTLESILPEYLTKIFFAGETMPTKQLNIWRRHLPNAQYVNLFGPTEITDTGTYYIVDRDFADTEPLPIGRPFPNCDVLILNEQNEEASKQEAGELCFKGPFLGLGYYNNPEKTKEIFVQNPLNTSYPETIYKTGDLVKYNEYGELMYLGRKDFQIKHMGYRIELGEIESNIFAIDGILSCACIYDSQNSKIVLFYQADTIDEKTLATLCKEKLLPYMVPNEIVKLDRMPMNANGKIDRVKLKEMER